MSKSQSALIIDQDPKWVEALTSILSEIGIHDITVANSWAGTIEAVKRTRFDLILIDVKAPEKEAVNLIKEILRIDLWTRVIVLSNICKREVVLACVYAGALQYILKTEDPRMIQNKILTVTEHTRTRRESAIKPPRTQFESFL